MLEVLLGIVIPFVGTILGSAMVFFMKNKINAKLEKLLLGFAGGVMFAASIWSLIIPAINKSVHLGEWSFVPALVGLVLGLLLMFVLGVVLPSDTNTLMEQGGFAKNKKMIMAITLHNIPEGLAMGVALAGIYFGNVGLSLTASLALSVGIAVQNIPEGAIVSLPLMQGGMKKFKAFAFGVLSGIVEPIFAVIAFFVTGFVSAILPYVLTFAGGAMIYVVVDELIPEAQQNGRSSLPAIGFAIGFVIMMVLDIALG